MIKKFANFKLDHDIALMLVLFVPAGITVAFLMIALFPY